MKSLAYGPPLAVLVLAVLPQMAFALDYGGGPTSPMTLEQEIDLAKKRIDLVKAHPGQGSGTPYLSPYGVIGATLITGGIFGGIFVAFVVRARQIENMRSRLVP